MSQFLSEKTQKLADSSFPNHLRKKFNPLPALGKSSVKPNPQTKSTPKYKEEEANLERIYSAIMNKQDDFKQKSKAHWDLMHMYQELIPITVPKERDGVIKTAKKEEDLANDAIEDMNLLSRISSSPYFGRIDFKFSSDSPIPRFRNQKYSFLVGKRGYELGDIKITDWRAPISSIYYNFPKETKNCFYKTDQQIINGELLLKRKVEIQDATLIDVYDGKELTSLVGSDPFLLNQLKKSSSTRLKDIISSIQAEQNKIISLEPDKEIIVQGVAGSGKTSIAVHRLSWLLYNYKEINPQQCLIVAPSEVFLHYIADILPEIGSENVPQTTFENWATHKLRHMINKDDYKRDAKTDKAKTTYQYMKKIEKLSKRLKSKKSFSEKDILKEYQRYTHSKDITKTDLAPLVYLRFLIKGMIPSEEIQYLVVDEAQDHSEAEIYILKRYAMPGRVLLVGDLLQGIINPNGITDWEKLMDLMFNPHETEYFEIKTSYRSTQSIIKFVNKRLKKAKVPKNRLPQPVLRKGDPPEVFSSLEFDEMISKMKNIIENEQKLENKNIAVIAPKRHIDLLAKELTKQKVDHSILKDTNTLYEGGIVIGSVETFKGLEFDSVILLDLDYDNTKDSLKRFYVGCTRAMHHLFVFEA